MKPAPLAACTVVALLGLYVGAYFGMTDGPHLTAGMWLRYVDSPAAVWAFQPAAIAEATWRGQMVVLIRPPSPGVTLILLQADPLW